MITTTQISARRQELIRRVEAVVAKKRAANATNGALTGHNDLLVALRDPKRPADYCPKCLVIATGQASCARETLPMIRCESSIFSVPAGG